MREQAAADLAAEGEALEEVLAALEPEDWTRPTPAVGWTVAAQVAHLAWTDDAALLAVTDPDVFTAWAVTEQGTSADRGASAAGNVPGDVLLDGWRAGRHRLAEALSVAPADTRLPWFGPPMSVTGMATARLMETWAHGVDIRDALGLPIEETRRLDHVARLGGRTRAYAFGVNGLPAPPDPVRVELERADGTRWIDGPEDAEQSVRGPMLHFCLRVVQRRPRSALSLVAVGPAADRWLDIAQAFAGEPGPPA